MLTKINRTLLNILIHLHRHYTQHTSYWLMQSSYSLMQIIDHTYIYSATHLYKHHFNNSYSNSDSNSYLVCYKITIACIKFSIQSLIQSLSLMYTYLYTTTVTYTAFYISSLLDMYHSEIYLLITTPIKTFTHPNNCFHIQS